MQNLPTVDTTAWTEPATKFLGREMSMASLNCDSSSLKSNNSREKIINNSLPVYG